MVNPVISQDWTAYLDTDVAVWLAERKLKCISARAVEQIEALSLLISPIVLVEIELRHEIARSKLSTSEIARMLLENHGVLVCDLPFATIAVAALDEKWTRDPFDRLIVANAKANGFAWLISADEAIRKHYPRTVW